MILRSTGLRLLLPLCVLLVAAGAAPGIAETATARDAADDRALGDLEQEIEAILAEWKIPGLGLSIVRADEVVLAGGYGTKDIESGAPVTVDTLFAIGSNSKSFTVTLLGMLSDDGLVDLDRPVRDVLPEFRLHDPVAGGGMTPRDLVTHRSGLPRHDLVWYGTGLDRAELLHRLPHLEPSHSFRSTYQYQNLMFMTAGHLAGRLTDSTWEAQVRERILEPLGMHRSNFSVTDLEEEGNASFAHGVVDDEMVRIPYRNIDEIGPAGSINSSPTEMASYVRFHLSGGVHEGERLLSERIVREMQSPQMVMPVTESPRDAELGEATYGMGLSVSTYRGRKIVGHGGGIDGFISAMEWLPNDDVGVVVLTNGGGINPVPTIVARTVLDRMLGLDPIDWNGRAREQQEKAREQAAEGRAKVMEERHEGTDPSHPLGDFTGEFTHPGYGTAIVTEADGQLRVSVVGFTVPLTHYHYDIFRVPDAVEATDAALAGRTASFHYDRSGEIDRLTIDLEPAVSDIVFERVADE